MFLGLRTVHLPRHRPRRPRRPGSPRCSGSPPYFDEPFFVGFNVGGYELALMPARGRPGARARSPTGACRAPMPRSARLVGLGATVGEPITEVGEGITHRLGRRARGVPWSGSSRTRSSCWPPAPAHTRSRPLAAASTSALGRRHQLGPAAAPTTGPRPARGPRRARAVPRSRYARVAALMPCVRRPVGELVALELVAEVLLGELADAGLGDLVDEDHVVGQPPLGDPAARGTRAPPPW